MDDKQPNLDSWGDFAGDYLKAKFVKEFPLKVAVKNVESGSLNGKPILSIVFEHEQSEKRISINKTNRNFLINNGVRSPKAIIGKILTFNKVRTSTPKGEIVDSFELVKVE